MYLKALEMHGFKSFPDKTVLNFGKGITAVVGPNGSGKSNISDAVRWVLGEQSTKSLRGSKMEDVVFSGTSQRRAMGNAEVTLVLDNSDRALNNDAKTVTVTRRYYRSGESEYKINGEQVRLKDVHELFMDTGLGRDGYSMVSQGKITDMISAKSTERRDMFEEAAGISHFRYRRTDALRRLSQAEENLVRLRDIFAELEARVEPLKVQSEKATEFLQLAGEKKELEIGLWLHTISSTKDRLSEQEQKLTVAQSDYKAAQTELEALEEQIEFAAERSRGITVELDNLRRNSSDYEERALALDGQIAVMANSIEHNNESVERIRREMEQEGDTTAHLSEQENDARAQIEAVTRSIGEKKEELLGVSGEQGVLLSEDDTSSRELSSLTSLLSSLSACLADERVRLTAASSSSEEARSRLDVIARGEEQRRPVIEALEQEREKARKELEESCEKLEELNNSLSGLELLAKKRKEKQEALEVSLRSLERELDAVSSRAHMLEDLEKNMEGYQGSVKAVMQEAKRGTLRGIHAPLSQLISVKDEYALAVETALGAQLQHIVTDDENDAKRAIAFLKESGAGRATFLPLTAIRGRKLDEKNADDCFGYIALASELVSFDAKYNDIIVSMLGRTVVAEDMDCAVNIARKYSYRFRIVTLDGQVINAGGSMTGGSKTHTAGMLGRAGEIEKLKKNAIALKSKTESVQAELKVAQESAAAAQAELVGHRSELTSCSEDKVRLEGVFNLKDGQLSAALGVAGELDAEKASLNARLSGLAGETDAANAEIERLNGEIAVTEEKLSALGENREKLSERRESITQRIADINLALLALQKELEAQTEIIDRLRRRSDSHSERIAAYEAEIKEFLDKNAALEADMEALKAGADGSRAQAQEAKAEIDSLTAQRDASESEGTRLRQLEKDGTSRRESLGSEVVRLEERKAAMVKEYDDICAKLFEEYELTRKEAEQLNIVIEDIPEARKRLGKLRNRIKSLGTVNVGAIEEFKEVSERYTFLGGQIEDIEKSKAELIRMIDELTSKMAVRFRASFDEINRSFAETFSQLFDGGKGSLELEDENDILECGIAIKVQPPGKNVQNIDLLSGGEKGLSAIALLFSILKVTPAPFCIYDEVEAALDDVNVARYASYVRRMTQNTQFILITHRRGTMEEADMLYGVTMQEEGVSKLLELKTAEMVKELGLDDDD